MDIYNMKGRECMFLYCSIFARGIELTAASAATYATGTAGAA
jgi:hypothetical protein